MKRLGAAINVPFNRALAVAVGVAVEIVEHVGPRLGLVGQ
jgi:hypothetical protein